MENFSHVNHLLHDLCLIHVPRNAIQHQSVDIWLKFVSIDRGINRFLPKLDRNLVGNELAFTRVLEEGFAYGCPGIDRAKDIAAGAVEKARDTAQSFALCAFAASGRTEEDERLVFHHWNLSFIKQTENLGNGHALAVRRKISRDPN